MTAVNIYKPEVDVETLAKYFVQTYGSIEKAERQLDQNANLDLTEFQGHLKRWGVLSKIVDVVGLFEHIDLDISGKVSVEELLSVLEKPSAEIQRRELERKETEVDRTFERIANSIAGLHGGAGDIAALFRKLHLPGVEGAATGGAEFDFIRDDCGRLSSARRTSSFPGIPGTPPSLSLPGTGSHRLSLTATAQEEDEARKYFDMLNEGTKRKVLRLEPLTMPGVHHPVTSGAGNLSEDQLEKVKTHKKMAHQAVRVFSKYDKDGSGSLEKRELRGALKELGMDLKTPQATAFLKDCDEDASGPLDRQEFIDLAFDLATEEKGISIAAFHKLIDHLKVELTPPEIQAAFSRIDEDGSNSVSVEELKKALSGHLVRPLLIAIGNSLTERFGSVAKAFDHCEDPQPVAASSRPVSPAAPAGSAPVPPLAGSAPVPPLMSSDFTLPPPPVVDSSLMNKDRFVRDLRKLKLLDGHDVLTEAAAETLYDSLQPFNKARFVALVQEKHGQAVKELARKQADEGNRKEKRDKLLREAAGANSSDRASQAVKKWAEATGTNKCIGGGRAKALTEQWAQAARRGASNIQVRDYVTALRDRLKEEEANMAEVKKDAELLAHARDRAPVSTPSMSPRSVRAEFKTKELTTAMKADRMVKAVTDGNVVVLRRLLEERCDPNVTAWGGVTPAMVAARHGREGALACLVGCKADLALTDFHGRTAVDHAYRQPSIRNWLRQRGGLSGQQLRDEAEELAQAILEMEAAKVRLNPFSTVDTLKRAAGRHRLLAASTPKAGEGHAATFDRFGYGLGGYDAGAVRGNFSASGLPMADSVAVDPLRAKPPIRKSVTIAGFPLHGSGA